MTVAEFAFALSARRYCAFSSGESQFPVPLTYFVFFFVKYRFVSFNI